MNDDEFEDGALARTCRSSELLSCTSSGWRVLRIVEASHQEPGLSYTVHEPAGPGSVYSYPTVVTKQSPPVVVQDPLFVLVKSRDRALAELRSEIRNLKDAEEQRKRILSDLDLELKNTQASLKKREAENIALKTAYDEQTRKLGNTSSSLSVAEEKLRKLHREIGEAQWRQILFPEEKS